MRNGEKAALDDIAKAAIGALPALDAFEQRLSLMLYRLLAEGQPVAAATLAERLAAPLAVVRRTLDGWPGVFCNSERSVIGYWGLALPNAYDGPHRYVSEGRTLAAWCAWDTLFLPELLGCTAEIVSRAPDTCDSVRLTVSPERVAQVEPAGACLSFLMPRADDFGSNVVSSFCHFVHFFSSREGARTWIAGHPGTFLLSIDEAHELGRRKNQAQYGAVLRSAVGS